MEISLISEEGFVDLNIPAILTEEEDGKLRINAKGEYKGRVIGFEVLVPEHMEPGISMESREAKIIHTYDLEFLSKGEETMAFFSILAEAYGVEPISQTIDNRRFTLLPLTDRPFDIRTDVVRTKIFFEEDMDRYCEAFFNFWLKEGFVGLNEKDPEYRRNLISVFGS